MRGRRCGEHAAAAGDVADPADQVGVGLEGGHGVISSLGAVAGSLQLQGGRLQLMLRAQDAGSAGLLRASGRELALALEAAGLPLDLMTVRHEPV